MEITNTNLDLIYRNANVRYQGALNGTVSYLNQIATTFPSATRQETYAWLERLPRLRKWFGNRVVNSANTHAQVVTNYPFELTVALKRRDVQDDQLGIFGNTVDEMGQQAGLWPDREIADFITSSTGAIATNGFDGVPFYSASHPNNGGDITGGPSGTQSNLYVNTALTYDNYVAQRAIMQSWTGFDGAPLNISVDTLMVPPALEGTGKLILEADFLANTAGTAPQTNVFKGTAKLLVNKLLANKPNNWFLLSTSNVVKPYLWQLRKAPVFTMLTDPASPNVFLANEFMYGLDSEGAASMTLWFLSMACTSAGSY